MLTNILERLGALWRQLEQAGAANERAVLVLTTFSSLQLELRVLAIEEGWRILFAQTLPDAIELGRMHGIAVILYDRDLPGVDWQTGLRSLAGIHAAFFILLSRVVDRRLWKAVLDRGGYDVARAPLDRDNLALLINGAFTLAKAASLNE